MLAGISAGAPLGQRLRARLAADTGEDTTILPSQHAYTDGLGRVRPGYAKVATSPSAHAGRGVAAVGGAMVGAAAAARLDAPISPAPGAAIPISVEDVQAAVAGEPVTDVPSSASLPVAAAATSALPAGPCRRRPRARSPRRRLPPPRSPHRPSRRRLSRLPGTAADADPAVPATTASRRRRARPRWPAQPPAPHRPRPARGRTVPGRSGMRPVRTRTEPARPGPVAVASRRTATGPPVPVPAVPASHTADGCCSARRGSAAHRGRCSAWSIAERSNGSNRGPKVVAAEGNCVVSYAVLQDVDKAFQAQVTIANRAETPVPAWNLWFIDER